MKIQDLPLHKRPRERLQSLGAQNLSDKELLAIIFRTGRLGKSALDIASDVLKKYTMKELLDIDFESLNAIKGIDRGKASSLLAALEIGKRALEAFDNQRPIIKSAQDVWLQTHSLQRFKKEHFVSLYLNARCEMLGQETISIGSLEAVWAHPREVFAPALQISASQLILVHNHPTGNPQPSQSDLEVTKRLRQAGNILGIQVLDHVILGQGKFYSFQENGHWH